MPHKPHELHILNIVVQFYTIRGRMIGNGPFLHLDIAEVFHIDNVIHSTIFISMLLRTSTTTSTTYNGTGSGVCPTMCCQGNPLAKAQAMSLFVIDITMNVNCMLGDVSKVVYCHQISFYILPKHHLAICYHEVVLCALQEALIHLRPPHHLVVAKSKLWK